MEFCFKCGLVRHKQDNINGPPFHSTKTTISEPPKTVSTLNSNHASNVNMEDWVHQLLKDSRLGYGEWNVVTYRNNSCRNKVTIISESSGRNDDRNYVDHDPKARTKGHR